MSTYIDEFLASVKRRGNLMFALDATQSREETWDRAGELHAQMFQEVSTVGALSMQLVYFRGVRNYGGECKASGWVEDPMTLAPLMSKITCATGTTQIELVLNHTIKEATRRQIGALVYVGDACEEERDVLVTSATRLAALNIPVFIFQEGDDVFAKYCFEEIARITKGKHFKFNSSALQQLADILGVIAKFCVGGVAALPPHEKKLIGRS